MQRIEGILTPVILMITGVSATVVAKAPATIQFYETAIWQGAHNVIASAVSILALYLVVLNIQSARKKLKQRKEEEGDDSSAGS